MTLTRFLENIIVSTLLGLPREIKELIYFDALSHAANKILVSRPLDFCRTLTDNARHSRCPQTSRRSTPTV